MAKPKELKVQEKVAAPAPAEQTKPGPVFAPNVDIFETEKEIILLADIPGVKPKDLSLDLNDGILTFNGEVKFSVGPGEENILTEYEVGSYNRQFTLAEVIDQNQIDAALKNGVLRVILPKLEKAVPRRITVRTE